MTTHSTIITGSEQFLDLGGWMQLLLDYQAALQPAVHSREV
jgi:hypothetical protein